VVRVEGDTLLQQLTQADVVSGDLTFEAAPVFIEIINEDPVNAGVFTVNGLALRVPAETTTGILRIVGTPSAVVEVTGSTAYIVNRRA
jgi:hypothetical protein